MKATNYSADFSNTCDGLRITNNGYYSGMGTFAKVHQQILDG